MTVRPDRPGKRFLPVPVFDVENCYTDAVNPKNTSTRTINMRYGFEVLRYASSNYPSQRIL